ncbi:MAG: hypothetical protein HY555_04390 [Euryarchaeota archaeon]|nr:hypothetical protein [Euryarchaeota archaeon]
MGWKHLIPLILLILIPQAHAQGLVVALHNATYTLEDGMAVVEEVMVFEYRGNDIFLEEKVYLSRDGTEGIEVSGTNYKVEAGRPAGIILNLFIIRDESKRVTLRYRRGDMLTERGPVKRFEGLALGRYTWLAKEANIKIIVPESYQLGNATPGGKRYADAGKEAVLYRARLFDGLDKIQDGFPIYVEYARFRELWLGEMGTARTLILEASYDLADANATIAKDPVGEPLELYQQAEGEIQKAVELLQMAEVAASPPGRAYYPAYLMVKEAGGRARLAARGAANARDLFNARAQRELEEKMRGMEQNFSRQSEALERNLTAKIEDLKRGDEPRETSPALRSALPIIVLVALLAVTATGVSRLRRTEGSRKGQIQEYRAIGDLKRKTFEGFEAKLGAVRRSSEIASETKGLMEEKRALEGRLEGLREKRMRGELADLAFIVEKKKVERQINEVASRIFSLERELEKMRGEKD